MVWLLLVHGLVFRTVSRLIVPSANLAPLRPLKVAYNLLVSQLAASSRVVEAYGADRVADVFPVRAAALPYLLGDLAHGGLSAWYVE